MERKVDENRIVNYNRYINSFLLLFFVIFVGSGIIMLLSQRIDIEKYFHKK